MGEEADTEKDKFLGLYFLIPNLLLPFNSCVIQAGCLISLSLVTTLLKCNIQFIRFFCYSLNDQFLILIRAAVYCQRLFLLNFLPAVLHFISPLLLPLFLGIQNVGLNFNGVTAVAIDGETIMASASSSDPKCIRNYETKEILQYKYNFYQ